MCHLDGQYGFSLRHHRLLCSATLDVAKHRLMGARLRLSCSATLDVAELRLLGALLHRLCSASQDVAELHLLGALLHHLQCSATPGVVELR